MMSPLLTSPSVAVKARVTVWPGGRSKGPMLILFALSVAEGVGEIVEVTLIPVTVFRITTFKNAG